MELFRKPDKTWLQSFTLYMCQNKIFIFGCKQTMNDCDSQMVESNAVSAHTVTVF